VVNVSATIAHHANSKDPAVLTALTKGGLAAATRSLAIEYASRGIPVNAVSPGVTSTIFSALALAVTIEWTYVYSGGVPFQRRHVNLPGVLRCTEAF
jgi:NAD(P)-dependent dehydrogenase (short-subunit alcohol dehydrogenase family)